MSFVGVLSCLLPLGSRPVDDKYTFSREYLEMEGRRWISFCTEDAKKLLFLLPFAGPLTPVDHWKFLARFNGATARIRQQYALTEGQSRFIQDVYTRMKNHPYTVSWSDRDNVPGTYLLVFFLDNFYFLHIEALRDFLVSPGRKCRLCSHRFVGYDNYYFVRHYQQTRKDKICPLTIVSDVPGRFTGHSFTLYP